jgi:hypothetical protein
MRRILGHFWNGLVFCAVAPLSSACASTSTLTIPSCADRVEIEEIPGQHRREGRTLVIDHNLDPPWSTTKLVLQGPKGSRVVLLDHRTPEPERVLAGCGAGAAGCGLGLFGLLGGGAGVVAAGAVVGASGAAVALTGWHPAVDDVGGLEAWCAEGASPP